MYKPLIIKGQADSGRKSCFDCYYCQGAVSWWCVNEDAQKVRGTLIPGTRGCSFWKAAKHIDEMNWFERLFCRSNYINVECEER